MADLTIIGIRRYGAKCVSKSERWIADEYDVQIILENNQG